MAYFPSSLDSKGCQPATKSHELIKNPKPNEKIYIKVDNCESLFPIINESCSLLWMQPYHIPVKEEQMKLLKVFFLECHLFQMGEIYNQ